ncbi:MAG TPA: hypothetical protein VGJ32_12400 [Solirubrobacteraceae bacterium]
MHNDPMEIIDQALRSTIGRVVAALTPVLAAAIGAAALWLQNVIGIDLQVDPAVAAAFIGSIILGGCLLGLKWLEGRASFEKIAMEILAAYEAGNQAVRDQAVATEEPASSALGMTRPDDA